METSASIRKSSVILISAALALVIVLIPIAFTLYKEGRFSPRPSVSIKPAITAPDAPELTFAADYDFNPYSFYDSRGNPSGLDIELATEIANRMGRRMKFILGNWQQCKNMIRSGEADILLGLEIFADEGRTSTLKTIPVSHDSIKIYGRSRISDVGSLYGKKVAISAGSILISLFDLNCDYIGFNTSTDILMAVQEGKADFGICHASVAANIIESRGLRLVPSMTLMESFPAMGIRESAPELREPVNLVLKSMADDGTIARLYDKWIAANIDNKSFHSVFENNTSFYIIYVFIAAFVLLGGAYLVSKLRLRENRLEMALSYQKVLEKEKKQAEDASRAKSDFLLNMSHDIRTPMNAILGFTDIAIQNISCPARAVDALEKSRYSSEHLLSIINDILDMSRIESGKIELHEEVIDVKEHIAKLEDMFRFSMEKKGLSFTVKDNSRTRYVYGDSLHISQIIANLLSNAMKFTASGGTVSYLCEEGPADNGTVSFYIHIADTGIGMSEEFQKRMFQPFEREKSATVSGVEGTGLGLSIAHRLAGMMGGSLTCKSRPGVGTEFTFSFRARIAPAPETAEDIRKPEKEISFNGRRLLLAEDNALNREIALAFLNSAGFKVEEAVNGAEALEKIQKSSPDYYDVVLMDVQMPVMDGYEAARAIRALPDRRRASLPIVAMTANAFDEDRQHALEAGMNQHIAKPIDPERLLKSLGELLSAQQKMIIDAPDQAERKKIESGN